MKALSIMLIAYYWPPSNGVAMHRWYHMSKHLAEMGHQLWIVVPEKADYPSIDDQINEKPSFQGSGKINIIKLGIFEIRKLYARSSKKSETTDGIFFKKDLSVFQKISLWVRANVFIPDARFPWIYQRRKEILAIANEKKVDLVISTGTPHSLHLIGLYIKRKSGIPWVADFRDPWTTIEYHDKMPMTRFAKKRHIILEKKVVKSADRVITVSPTWAKELSELGEKEVSVVYNGYEESLFDGIERVSNQQFTISHIGTLRSDRNPDKLWKVLKELSSEVPFQVHLYGEVGESVKESIHNYELERHVVYEGFVTHRKALQAMISSDLLLLPINKDVGNSKGRIPAKVFEYLRSGVPIVVFEPQEGDISKMTRGLDGVYLHSYEDENSLLETVRKISKGKGFERDAAAYSSFSRKYQALELNKLLQTVA